VIQNAGQPCRLIASSPKIPHSFQRDLRSSTSKHALASLPSMRCGAP
jgi:hypothetical protein